MHLVNVLSSFLFVYTFCIPMAWTEGHELWWSLSYIKLLASSFIWSTVAGSTPTCRWTTVLAPCLLWLEAPSSQGRPLEQILSWIMHLRKHCHRTTIAEAPLPARWSRAAGFYATNIVILYVYRTMVTEHPAFLDSIMPLILASAVDYYQVSTFLSTCINCTHLAVCALHVCSYRRGSIHEWVGLYV